VRDSRAAATRAHSLTDFASGSAPSIPTASMSDLMALNPADIVTKLKARGAAPRRVAPSARVPDARRANARSSFLLW
jgi:hypothetical protein